MLENDLSELVRLLAVQEKSHRFHLAAGVRPRTSTAPRVRVIDSEDPTLVRADCDTRSIEISTGFLRRLLEAAVESVNSGERMPERPEWYTEELGNWPPAVASLYDLQKHYYSATASVSLGPKMMAIVHQLALLDREVLPAAEAALRKTGFDGAFAEYAARFEPQSRSTYEPAIRAARSLQLPPRVAKRLVQISTRIREYEASFETDPEAEREFESFITQYQGGFEDAAEAISLLTLYTMMVEQEYLKALAFAVAHEGAHIWFIGCERDVDNENRADAYGALVAFEMFSNHHRKLNVRSNAKLVLPLPFGDDQTSDLGDFDALEWFVRATGRSGVELMVSVYRDVKGVDPASHASFESRREAVSELYRNLVATTVRTTAQ
jgi:hypothetical protein